MTADTTTPVDQHQAGLDLLNQVKSLLGRNGWTQTRVDTLTHDDPKLRWVTIRHHYTGGIWELTTSILQDGRVDGVRKPLSTQVQKWRLGDTMPDAQTVTNEIYRWLNDGLLR